MNGARDPRIEMALERMLKGGDTMETIKFNPQDRGVFQDLTKAIEELSRVVNNSNKLSNLTESFHSRQVPALQRQSEAIEYLKHERDLLINLKDTKTVDKEVLFHIIDRACSILLST